MTPAPSTPVGVEQSIAAASMLFDDPAGIVEYEPTSVAECVAAVETLLSCFLQAGGTVKAMTSGALQAAQVLSDDRLQGLTEIIQNADDVGATQVRIVLRGQELLAIHNGRPVSLRDVHALAFPFLTTKRNDIGATGRFGIGLSTLRSLAPVYEMHSGNYHLLLGNPEVEVIAPLLRGDTYTDEETIVRITLDEDTSGSELLKQWSDHWDDSSLLFLRSVGRVSIKTDLWSREFCARRTDLPPGRTVCGGSAVTVERSVFTTSTGQEWLMHRADVSSPTGLARAHKKTGTQTPIGVALALQPGAGPSKVFAGLPIAETRLPLHCNAQFDPIASRRGLADTDWNHALAGLVADLWLGAVLEVFERDPRHAWHLVPSSSDECELVPAGAMGDLEIKILDRAHDELPRALQLWVDESPVSIAELAVEEAALSGVLSPDEIAELAGLTWTLPADARDVAGHWRHVLASWRQRWTALPPELSVLDAMPLLERPERDVPRTIALTAAAISTGLKASLRDFSCLVTSDGSRTSPPLPGELRVLCLVPVGLASVLGIGVDLDPGYRDETEAAETVRTWLRSDHALASDASDELVLRLIASAGDRHSLLERPLNDDELCALRDALEGVSAEDRDYLGPRVGRAILIEGFEFDNRHKRKTIAVRPSESYLSKAIESGVDTFAKAAGETPGLLWVAARYATVLRSAHGRSGLGPQKFLRLLGVEVAPRLRPHPRLERKYQDSRLGLPRQVSGSQPGRVRGLLDLSAAYSLDDKWSPDLDAVLAHIAKDPRATRRRERARAMIEVLGRAWPDLADSALVTAAEASYGWQPKGDVRAWWLWSAGQIPWLDNASGRPMSPHDLRMRTSATVAVHGDDKSLWVHPSVPAARADVLSSLGVAGEPQSRDLVERLKALSTGEQTADAPTEAAVVYQALAARLGSRRHGDLTAQQLRDSFAVQPGLILSRGQWLTSAQVLRGERVLGHYKHFVPAVPGTEVLWQHLRIAEPSVDDCLDVLRALSRASGDADAESVTLDVLRELERLLRTENLIGSSTHRRLRNAGLPTSQGWLKTRPIFSSDDQSLITAIGDKIPVWQPGGELAQFDTLHTALGITRIRDADRRLVTRASARVDVESTDLAREAIALLREDLQRNDPSTLASVLIPWSDLQALEVKIANELTVSLESAVGRDFKVSVPAHLDRQALTLYLTDPAGLGRMNMGAAALAGLFNADHRYMCQTWHVAVSEAAEGRLAAPLRLAAERTEEAQRDAAQSLETLLSLRERGRAIASVSAAATANSTTGQKTPRSSIVHAGAVRGNPPERAPRVLVDPTNLVLRNQDGEIVLSAAVIPREHTPRGASSPAASLPEPRTAGAAPRSTGQHRSYTDQEKEKLGLELVRKVLASDDVEITDLRAQHGVGADAVDALGNFYELKVHAGEEPDEVALEPSQVQRALSTPGFFLVVVSGIEGDSATPRLRVIADPLSQLRVMEASKLKLSGVRAATSLIYDFGHRTD